MLTSAPPFEVTAGFGLPEDKDPGLIGFKGGKFARHLRPKVFPGVFAGIPHDAFAAVVTSFHLPPNMEEDSWHRLASIGPEEEISNSPEDGGVALIWDLEHLQDGISSMGVVIANQSSADEVAILRQILLGSGPNLGVRGRHSISGGDFPGPAYPNEGRMHQAVAKRP